MEAQAPDTTRGPAKNGTGPLPQDLGEQQGKQAESNASRIAGPGQPEDYAEIKSCRWALGPLGATLHMIREYRRWVRMQTPSGLRLISWNAGTMGLR
jgi:hypothetical protein